MKRLLKWLAILLLVLVLLILIVLLLSYILLGTDRGFKFGFAQLEDRVEGLEIGEINGNLSDGIQTDRIDFKNEQIELQAQGLDSQWRSNCLFDKELCIDKVVIDKLSVETFATGEEKTASTGDISLPEIDLPVSFNAKEILIKQFEFKAPGDAPVQTLQNIKLSAYTEENTLNINELSTAYQNFNVFIKGAITPNDNYPLNVDIMINATDMLEEQDVHAQIKLYNTLENLEVDVAVGGAFDAQVQANVQPLKRKLPANVTIKSKQLGWPLDTMQSAKAENLVISATGDMDDYNFSVSTKLTGEQIPESEIKVSGKANTERALLTDLTTLTLGGFATGQAAMSWSDGVTWVTELIAKDINPAVHYEGVDGKLNGLIIANGNLIDEKWTLDLSKARIDGVLREVPFELDGKIQKQADDTWQLDSLVLNNGRNRINAYGTITDKWDLKADINMPELQNLLPDLSGGFKADLVLQGELENPDVQLNANTASIKYQEIAIAGLSLTADVKRGALDNSKLELKIAKVQAGEQALQNTRIGLNGTREKHTVDLFTDGPQKTSIDLLAAGGLNTQFDWAGSLNEVKIEVPAHDIVLRNKTDLAWDNQSKKFSIDPHCWGIQDSNLCLKNRVLAEESGKAIIDLDTYALAQLNPFLPADSELLGQLKATVTLDWGEDFAGGYAASLDMGVTNGGISVKDGSGQRLSFSYETLTLNSKADAKAVDGKLTIDSERMGQALVDLTLDPASEKKPISGNVELSGFKLGFLKAFLPNFDELSGVLSTKGDISGELLDPLYNGQVVASSLKVRSEDLPLAVDDGNITAVITGKRAKIDGNLQSGDGGVGISGTANWLNESYRADINLRADTLSIAQDPLTDSTVNAELNIAASPEQVRVRGNIDIPAAEINIKELPKGAATVSDDVIVIEDIYAQTLSKQNKKATATKVDLKLNVTLGEEVNLSGYGFIRKPNRRHRGIAVKSQSGAAWR